MGRKTIRWILPLVVVATLGAGAAMAATSTTHTAGTVSLAKSGKYGMVLVSGSGRTLYRYTPDSKGHNTCAGACATYWPALVLKGAKKPTAGSGANAALLGTIKHGKLLQVTYAGYPLYTYVGDTKAGQFNGQGKDSTWYLVNAKGALVKKAVASNASSTTTTPAATTTTGGAAWG